MARKSNQPQHDEIDDLVGDDGEADSESTTGAATGKRMTKAGAARAALAAGVEVPKQASVYIKQRFGVDISPQQFSAEKCRLKQRATDPVSSPYGDLSHYSLSATGSSRHRSFGKTDVLEALEVIKPLIDQLGADKVKRMVDLLG